MFYRFLCSVMILSPLLVADTGVVRSQTASDEPAPPAGALILEKGEDDAVQVFSDPFLRVSKRLHPDSRDCASAKIDVWIDKGQIQYVVFAPRQPWGPGTMGTSKAGPEYMIFGFEKCRIRVTITADGPTEQVDRR